MRSYLKTIKNIKGTLLEGGIFINAFVSTSLEGQKYMNTFWSDFTTKCNIKGLKTERYFSTPEEMDIYFQNADFFNQYYFLGFHNTGIIRGKEGFSGKYPSLTKEDIDFFEERLLEFPKNIKENFDIKKVSNTNGIKTVSISQPVYIMVGKK